MTFDTPLAFLLLALTWPLLHAARGARRRLQLWLLGMMALLVLALAGPTRPGEASGRLVWLVVDRSASVSAGEHDWRATAREVAARLGPQDRLGVVGFAGEAAVLAPPGPPQALGALAAGEARQPERSELAAALRFVDGLDGGRGEVLLLSDGVASSPALYAGPAARRLSTLATPPVADWRIATVAGPRRLAPQESLALTVTIEGSVAGEGELVLFRGGAPLCRVPVSLPRPGRLQLGLAEPALREPLAGPRSYSLELRAGVDRRRGNEVALWATAPADKPTVWWVGADATGWIRALDKVASVEAVPVAQLGRRLRKALRLPAAVVMADLAREALVEADRRTLLRYQADGGGLLFVGGPRSIGGGSWIDSELEARLPVRLAPAQGRQPASVVCLVDGSGSMPEQVGGRQKLAYARDALVALADALSPTTELAVLAFATEARLLVPRGLKRDGGEPLARVLERLPDRHDPRGGHPLYLGGATKLAPSLEGAIAVARASQRPRRHLVMLTDAAATDLTPARVAALRRQLLAAPPIALTVVRIASGEGRADPQLGELAQASGGRLIPVRRPAELPRVLVDSYRRDRFEPLAPAGARVERGPDSQALGPIPWPSEPLAAIGRTPLAPDVPTARAQLLAAEAGDAAGRWALLARRDDPGRGRVAYTQLTAAPGWAGAAWGGSLPWFLLMSQLAWVLEADTGATVRWEARFEAGRLGVVASERRRGPRQLGVAVGAGAGERREPLIEREPGLHRAELALPVGFHDLRLLERAADGRWRALGPARRVSVPYTPELASASRDLLTLERLAAAHRGRRLAQLDDWTPAPPPRQAPRPLAPWVLAVAALWFALGALLTAR